MLQTHRVSRRIGTTYSMMICFGAGIASGSCFGAGGSSARAIDARCPRTTIRKAVQTMDLTMADPFKSGTLLVLSTYAAERAHANKKGPRGLPTRPTRQDTNQDTARIYLGYYAPIMGI